MAAEIAVVSPIDGSVVARRRLAGAGEIAAALAAARAAQRAWRAVPLAGRLGACRRFVAAMLAKKQAIGAELTRQMGRPVRYTPGEVERMASFLARSGVSPRRVIHSGKLRAGETAAILARALAPGLMLEEAESLGPNDSVDALIAAAQGWAETGSGDVMVAGHMPFMARALAGLVGAETSLEFAAFGSGAVACLEPGPGGRWRLLWLVSPELLGS